MSIIVKEIEFIKESYFSIKTTDNNDRDYFKRVRIIKDFLNNINLDKRSDQVILIILYNICFHHLAYSTLKLNKTYYINIKDILRTNNDYYLTKYIDDVLVKVLTKQNINMDSKYIENIIKDIKLNIIDYTSNKRNTVNSDSIASIIKERIDNFELNIDVNNSGKIVSYADGVAEVYGIKNLIAGDMVEFENYDEGMVSAVNESTSSVVLLSKGDNIKEGMICNKTDKKISVPYIKDNLNNKGGIKMNKLRTLSLASAGAMIAGDYLSDIMLGRNKKTASDIRCKEKKVAKRRAKNKNKKKGK